MGGGWGLFSYLRIRKSELNNFLKIFVEVEEIGNEIYIKTKVDNPINRYKYIKSAFLIINYANEQPNESFKQNISTFLGVVNLKNTNELIAIANQKKRVCCKNAFIPLPYFYDENIRVGNEFLTYIYVLNRNECNLLLSGIYEVRFFVFSKEGHLHRSVQSAFRLNGSSNQRVCDKCEIKFKNLKPVSGTSKKVI